MFPEFSFKLAFFGLILLAVVLEIAADVLFKKWAIESRTFLFIIGLLLYFVGTIFWAVSLKYEFLSKAISVFTLLNLIIIVFVGTMFFNENLSFINKIGVGLGVFSIILIEI